MFRSKTFRGSEKFGSEFVWGRKKIWVGNFWVKKNLGRKFLSKKKTGSEIACQKSASWEVWKLSKSFIHNVVKPTSTWLLLCWVLTIYLI